MSEVMVDAAVYTLFGPKTAAFVVSCMIAVRLLACQAAWCGAIIPDGGRVYRLDEHDRSRGSRSGASDLSGAPREEVALRREASRCLMRA